MHRESGNIEQAGLVAAVEQTADGIVIADTDGKIQYVNPAFTVMTGYTSEEAVGQYPRILKSGLEPAEFYTELWNTIRSGRVWHGELINRRKDGTFYHEEMRITPVRDSKGEIASYIAIKHDVTERRAAEEAQRFLAAIVESSEDAIAAYTPAGIILTWNRGAESIFGYTARDAIGKHVSMLAERPAGLAHFTEQVLQGRVVSQYEGLCRRQDGRTFHVSVTGSPIRNAAGEVVAISAVLRDISERQEAEQARALLASIVESSDDAIHSVSLDGTILSWNRGAEMLFGYSRQEAIGQSAAILAPPGRSDELRQILGAIRDGFSICPFERSFLGKDGRADRRPGLRLPDPQCGRTGSGRVRHRPRHPQPRAGGAEVAGKRGTLPRGLRPCAIWPLRHRPGRAHHSSQRGALPDAGIFRGGIPGNRLGPTHPPR